MRRNPVGVESTDYFQGTVPRNPGFRGRNPLGFVARKYRDILQSSAMFEEHPNHPAETPGLEFGHFFAIRELTLRARSPANRSATPVRSTSPTHGRGKRERLDNVQSSDPTQKVLSGQTLVEFPQAGISQPIRSIRIGFAHEFRTRTFRRVMMRQTSARCCALSNFTACVREPNPRRTALKSG